MRTDQSFAHRVVAAALAVFLPGLTLASSPVRVPAGTTVFCELDGQVTSKKRDTAVGDIVSARIWRDVLVDGRVVIKAGTPVMARVAMVKPAKIAGRKGDVHIDALSTHTIDGDEVLLDGGYDKSGKGHKALAWSLFAVVAWPLVFIKGKQAVLPPGTVFDSTVQADVAVEVPDDSSFAIKIDSGTAEFEAEVLYDEMDAEKKQTTLPLRLRSCTENPIASAAVVTVNDKPIPALSLTLGATTDVDNCHSTRATVGLKELARHFAKGINRFVIESGAAKTEVILEIEL